jgi:hypothetical protein
MPRSLKIAIAGVVIAIGAALIAVLFVFFMGSSPSTIDFTADHQAGQPVNLNIQTVGSIGFGAHPTWVSYLAEDPQGQWVHTTLWQVPAYTRINFTIYQYDSGSPLRNQLMGRVTGTLGRVMSLQLCDGPGGRCTTRPTLVSLINSNAGNGVGHTFTIPGLGVNVPLYGNNATASLCAVAPCTTNYPHNIVKFSVMTPGPGEYNWQCFVPCGLGFLYGNGGPMSSVGYMGGFLKVVA